MTFNLLGREKPLNIYGPRGIKNIIISLLKIGNTWTNYKLNFTELDNPSSEIIYDKNDISITTIPLYHGIYTNGFLFRKKTSVHKLLVDKALSFGIDKTQFAGIKLGKDGIGDEGSIIENIKLVEPLKPDLTYAYCSDTLFNEKVIKQIKGCDLLYHESTFLKKHENFAKKTFHSTAEQAALIAKKSNVKKLILGHFSTRYKDLTLFLKESKSILIKGKNLKINNSDLRITSEYFEIAASNDDLKIIFADGLINSYPYLNINVFIGDEKNKIYYSSDHFFDEASLEKNNLFDLSSFEQNKINLNLKIFTSRVLAIITALLVMFVSIRMGIRIFL